MIVIGEIECFNWFLNCFYFWNWKNVDDIIFFIVEVVMLGFYEVVFYYVVKEVGVSCELRF